GLEPHFIGIPPIRIYDDLSLPRKHPTHASGGSKVPTGAAEQVSDIAARTVAVVRHRLDHDGDAMRAIAFEAKLLHLGTTELSGATHDRPFDVVLRHVHISR